MSRVLPILFNADMVRAILDGKKTVTRRVINPQPKFRLCYTFAGCNHGTWSYPSDTAHEFWGEGYRLPDFITDEDRQMAWNPPYHADDILYVRESWRIHSPGFKGMYIYGANYPKEYHRKMGLKSPICMPKEAARIWLKVTDVWVERLQDITEEQAEKEGLSRLYDDVPDNEYSKWLIRTGIYPKSKEEWGYKNYLWHGNFGECGTGNWKSDCWEYQYSSYNNAVGSFSSLWNFTIKKSDLDRYGWDANPWVWVIEFERCEKPENF